MITVRSTINLAHQSVPEVIPAVQGDTGRSILFSLADFTIPTGATARYFITKPSGLAVYNDATIDGNTVLVDLTAQSIAEYGDCPGQVRISVGDTVVTSFEFILHVEPFRGIDAVESTTEMNIFDALVTSAVDEAREQIEDIAEEVIETIPDDYTALTENVADLNETIYDLAEAQGNPVIIYDGADNVPVKDLKITFSASSNVNRIQVVRSGKNLVVDKLANGAVDGDGKYTNNSKRITNSFTSTYPISRTWLKAGTYTLSVPGLSACTVVIKTDSTTVTDAWALEQALPFTFTTQTGGYFIFSARNSANTDISPSDYHAQLEAGSKATDFEPARIKTVTTILYPLSISEGVLDFTTGQLTSGGSVYAVDAADISTVEGYNRIDAYMMSNSTAHMASTTSMDVIYRKNEYAWDKFLNVYPTETAQGNPATFSDGADGIPVKDLKVSIVPQQDLHGYDKPWAGGAGKNLCEQTVASIKALNTDGTWNGNAYTWRGITYTILTDSANNVIGYDVDGTATARGWLFISDTDFGSVDANYNNSLVQGYVFTSDCPLYDISHYLCFYNSTTKRSYILVDGLTANHDKWYPMVKLSSVSDATYEPYSNLCPITGMTEVEVERTGKNLLPINQSGGTAAGVTLTVSSDGTVIANGTSTSSNFKNVFYSTSELGGLQKGVSYICTTDNDKMGVGVYAYVGSLSRFENTRNNYVAFTLPSDATGILIRLEFANGVTFNNETIGVMVRLSSDSEEFAPYHTPQTVSTDLGRTVYGGVLDVTTGVLTVDRVSEVFDENTSWGNPSAVVGDSALFAQQVLTSASVSHAESTVFQGASNYLSASSGDLIYAGAFGVNCNGRWLGIRIPHIDTKEKLVAFMAQNPLQVVYPLATPVTYQLTPQELLSVLGTNHISTDADSVEVVYRADIAMYIENLTEPDADMIADTNITSGSYFMVGNTLYLATANIANGAAVVVGTNCVRSNLASALNAINA